MTGDLSEYLGRTRALATRITSAQMAALAGLLDRPEPPAVVPVAWHWAGMAPYVRQSQIGADGHPRPGDFLPPQLGPRRMFAGSAIQCLKTLEVDADIHLQETLKSVREKQGASGRLVFVELERRLDQGGQTRVTETQTLVYREAVSSPSSAAAQSLPPPVEAQWRREITCNPVLLFRFSAATANSHRIHYDRPYAMEVESYPALVVHGPLIAILLLEGLAAAHPNLHVRAFSFRALKPLFDSRTFQVCGALQGAKATLWAEAPEGGMAMLAEAVVG